MKTPATIATVTASLALVLFSGAACAQSFSEGFNGAALPSDWVAKNLSTNNASGTPWGVTDAIADGSTVIVAPYEGAGFAVVDFSSIGTGSGTISNWLISPEITGLRNGDTVGFYTTTVPGSSFADRLELRLSTAGASTDTGTTPQSVGAFTVALTSVNPTLAVGGYPENWTLVSVTLSGLSGPVDGRVALRYFVDSGGPAGTNSNIIGVDAFSYAAVAQVPEPAAWALMAGGLAAMAALRRRRRG